MEFLKKLTLDDLSILVRILRENNQSVATSWSKHEITSGGSESPVYRIRGKGHEQGVSFSWSLILKYCTNIGRWGHVYAVDDPSWRLEMLLYQSGLLDGIPSGLRPPRLIAASEQSPTGIALWLEDVGEDWSEKWPVERYAEAAYHLGQFNAHYAGRPPTEAWLGRNQWRDYFEGTCMEGIGLLEKHQDHPDVLAVYPKAIQQRLFALRDMSADFIDQALALSPLTLYHGDAGGRNLYNFEGCTVAIDWFDAGIAPLGEEVARMVGSSIHWFFHGRMHLATELADGVIQQYLDGLREAGWCGDEEAVRFTYRAALAVIYGLSYSGRANTIVRGEIEAYATGPYQTTAAALLQHIGEMARFFIEQAEQAQALSKRLS